jgi:two-component system response regulator HydG
MKPKLRVLIVDDDQRMTGTLADILSIQGFETIQAHSGAEALQALDANSFDCVLTDVKMPAMNGVDFCREVHRNRPGLPVVLMTAYAADELLHAGLHEGAIGVLNKPIDMRQLLEFLTSLGDKNVVTVVDDDPDFCRTLAEILQLRGFRVAKITDPHAGIDLMAFSSQVILLDIRLNSVNGLDLLIEIRQAYPSLPVLLVTGYQEEMINLLGIQEQIGTQTCLSKPVEIPTLLQILEEVQLKRLRPLLGSH